MLSRRDILASAAAAGALTLGPLPSRADMPAPKTAPDFEVPKGACDCHVHVFLDPAKFPFASTRVYTPPTASADELLTLHNHLRMERVVIVQPSVYGTDNSATVDGMRQLGPARARGVAVIDEKATGAQLDELHRAGIRGIRLNLETGGVTDPAASAQRLKNAVEQLKGRDWHIQIYTRLSVIEGIKDELRKLPMPVVFDHFAGARASEGVGQPGFATVLDLVKSGKAYVKISGAYRSSEKAPDFGDAAPFAKALIAANPDRIVWGTDWPHPDSARVPGRATTDIAPPHPIDDGLLLNQLPLWAPDAETRRKILVENPGRLYQFG
jgi:predicted TIM-barrel fold metal-dependent hydrolase